MSMMTLTCQSPKSGSSNPLPVMGSRGAASGQHWLGFTGCPRESTERRQGHTNSAVLCKLSSRTHAAGLLLLPLGVAFAASAVFDFIEALYHRPQENLTRH